MESDARACTTVLRSRRPCCSRTCGGGDGNAHPMHTCLLQPDSASLVARRYQNPVVTAPLGPDGLPMQVDERWVQNFYEEFYEDVFEEVAQFGEIENLNVCDNIADHMVGIMRDHSLQPPLLPSGAVLIFLHVAWCQLSIAWHGDTLHGCMEVAWVMGRTPLTPSRVPWLVPGGQRVHQVQGRGGCSQGAAGGWGSWAHIGLPRIGPGRPPGHAT